MLKKRWIAITALLFLGMMPKGHTAGFYLIEQSVSSMGNAYAGAAAVAEDATTIYFNPAGMTRLCGWQTIGAGHVVLPSVKYHDDGSVYKPEPIGGELLGGNGKDAGEPALVGNFYTAKNCGCLAFGLGVTSPFGLVTDYGSSWKGRYYAVRSAVLTIDINPSIAWKINECWSIGAGFRAMYLHAKLTSEVDFGFILGSNPQNPNPGLFQQLDGSVELKGNSWGYGGNAGILYEPWCGTRFGIGYRSEIQHKISGDEKFRNVPSQLAGIFQDTRTHSVVTLPSFVAFSAYHELNNCWAVLGDVTWFKWSTVQELRFSFNNPNQPDGVTTLKWKNSLRYSVGATYSFRECWKFRFGFAYDNTPTRGKEYTTPRVPDSDRLWGTLGFHYQWSSCIGFDVGYAHIWAKKSRIDKTDFALDEDLLRGGLKGHWNSRTDIISAQAVYTY